METLLIHGFGTKANYDIGWFKYPPNEDFKAWETEIKEERAKIFSWGISVNFGYQQILNPLEYLNLYNREKSLAKNKYMLEKLHKTIQELQPKHILAHSMGAFLLENYCGTYELSANLKKITFSQADLVEYPNLQSQLKNLPDLKLINYNCFWDQALWSSVAVNFKTPAGLFGLNLNENINPKIQNKFWALGNLHKNCHVDGINNDRFREEVGL